MKSDGCVHLIIKGGKIANIALHLSKLPRNGVVHLKADEVYSFTEFKKSHPEDVGELEGKKYDRVVKR